MTQHDLAQECSRRGIEIPTGSSNRTQATRDQMIISIQDHVKAVQTGLGVGDDWEQMEEDGLADL